MGGVSLSMVALSPNNPDCAAPGICDVGTTVPCPHWLGGKFTPARERSRAHALHSRGEPEDQN